MQNNINISRGYVYILGGIIILLYVLGFISKVLNIVLAIVAIGLIAYGLYNAGVYHTLKNRLSKK